MCVAGSSPQLRAESGAPPGPASQCLQGACALRPSSFLSLRLLPPGSSLQPRRKALNGSAVRARGPPRGTDRASPSCPLAPPPQPAVWGYRPWEPAWVEVEFREQEGGLEEPAEETGRGRPCRTCPAKPAGTPRTATCSGATRGHLSQDSKNREDGAAQEPTDSWGDAGIGPPSAGLVPCW